MVKLGRGGMGGSRGRQKPRPLFPPGELPLFGPPPAYIRRPPGPPIPPARGPRAYGPPPQLPPPPPPMRPPHLGPPMPLPHHPMNMRRRPGPGPPPMPLLQAPPMPPRPAPFMRGPPMPRLGPGGKKLGKPMKRGKNKKNKNKPNTSKPEGPKTTTEESKKEENVLEGPWITDAIKVEIEKLNDLKKKSEGSKPESNDTKLYNEQKEKVTSMAAAAKKEYTGSQPSTEVNATQKETKNGVETQK